MKPSTLFFGVGVSILVLIIVASVRGETDWVTCLVLMVAAISSGLLGLSLREEGK